MQGWVPLRTTKVHTGWLHANAGGRRNPSAAAAASPVVGRSDWQHGWTQGLLRLLKLLLGTLAALATEMGQVAHTSSWGHGWRTGWRVLPEQRTWMEVVVAQQKHQQKQQHGTMPTTTAHQ